MKILTFALILLVGMLTISCAMLNAFLTKPAPPLSDLAIVNIGYGTDPYGCSLPTTQFTLEVAITNKGTADAGPFTVNVDGILQTVSQGLGAGKYLSLTFFHASQAYHTVVIDPENAIQESDKTNNRKTDILPPLPSLPPPCTPTPIP